MLEIQDRRRSSFWFRTQFGPHTDNSSRTGTE